MEKILKNLFLQNISNTHIKFFWFFLFFFLLLLNSPMQVDSIQIKKIIHDFSNRNKIGRWMVVNDDVMGGVSRSEISLHPKGYLVFEGLLSTDYGGGFASLRSNYVNWEIANSDGIILKVRGDGKIYQFRCRMGNDYYDIAYRSFFKSKKNLWQVIKLPFREFVPTYRGRIVTGMPSLDPKDIRSFGLMISEKQVGDFRLEVSWIGVY